MSGETPREERGVRRGRIVRGWWFAIGLLCVGIGGIGVVVPGLPTTGFMIVAAWCFARSSTRFEQWVLNLPGVGQAIRDHRSGLGMPRRAKVSAIAMMGAAVTLSAVLLRDRPAIAAIVVLAGLIGTWYILRRVPTKELVLAASSRATVGRAFHRERDGPARPAPNPLNGPPRAGFRRAAPATNGPACSARRHWCRTGWPETM